MQRRSRPFVHDAERKWRRVTNNPVGSATSRDVGLWALAADDEREDEAGEDAGDDKSRA
jgi:hypothetical protein